MKLVATLAAAAVTLTMSASVAAQSPRALTIEDYYRITTVGDTQISPDGKWVVFTQSRRVEDDNTNAIDTFVVPVDGSAAPRRITHDGRSVAQPRWTDDNMLQYSLNAKTNSDVFVGGTAPTPRIRPDAALFKVDVTGNAAPVAAKAAPAGSLSGDGKWRAIAQEIPRVEIPLTGESSPFVARHVARFKGRQFDWMRFQADGQDYPTAD
ncbi:MAG TPA: hypothetical protein VFZ31_14755, partial [Vicinamibacterales bacterium]